MVYSGYKQQRILYHYSTGKRSDAIVNVLREEGMQVSKTGVVKFLNKFKETGSISRRPGSGRPTKITTAILSIVERQMTIDDETTAVQLQQILADSGHPLSLNTILRSRTKLGWTFRGSAYCQLIRDSNKAKRLEWAGQHLESALTNGFTDVVWTDECSIQMEAHRRFCCRKQGQQARPKPRCVIYTLLNSFHSFIHKLPKVKI